MSLALAVTDEGLDLALGEGGLLQDESIGSALLMSFLADARARDTDVALLGDGESRRGWWADADGARFGSRLWLLDRNKATAQVLREAEALARDALAWMLEQGIAQSVDVTTRYAAPGQLQIDVTIEAASDQRWAFLWRAAREGTFIASGCTFGWRVA